MLPLARRNHAAARAEDEAGRRATIAAVMLSQRITGGAVAAKARQWESVVAAHRGGISSAFTAVSIKRSNQMSSYPHHHYLHTY